MSRAMGINFNLQVKLNPRNDHHVFVLVFTLKQHVFQKRFLIYQYIHC